MLAEIVRDYLGRYEPAEVPPPLVEYAHAAQRHRQHRFDGLGVDERYRRLRRVPVQIRVRELDVLVGFRVWYRG